MVDYEVYYLFSLVVDQGPRKPVHEVFLLPDPVHNELGLGDEALHVLEGEDPAVVRVLLARDLRSAGDYDELEVGQVLFCDYELLLRGLLFLSQDFDVVNRAQALPQFALEVESHHEVEVFFHIDEGVQQKDEGSILGGQHVDVCVVRDAVEEVGQVGHDHGEPVVLLVHRYEDVLLGEELDLLVPLLLSPILLSLSFCGLDPWCPGAFACSWESEQGRFERSSCSLLASASRRSKC